MIASILKWLCNIPKVFLCIAQFFLCLLFCQIRKASVVLIVAFQLLCPCMTRHYKLVQIPRPANKKHGGTLKEITKRLTKPDEAIKKAYGNKKKGYNDKPSIKGIENIGKHTWEKLGKKVPLFTDIKPDNVVQGKIGTCYLLSSLSALAERKDVIRNLFLPHSGEKEFDYIYGMRIFLDGIERDIFTNDEILVQDNNKEKPIFASSRLNQLWPSIAEKIYAQAYGSYADIEGGHTYDALSDLTGAPVKIINNKTESTGEIWKELKQADEKGYFMCASTDDNLLDEILCSCVPLCFISLFNHIIEILDRNCCFFTGTFRLFFWLFTLPFALLKFIVVKVLGCKFCFSLCSAAPALVRLGLAPRHAYSILGTSEISDSKCCTTTKCIIMRNPWGKTEFKDQVSTKGKNVKISDSSALESGELTSDNENDGIFYIKIDKFLRYFKKTSILYLNPNADRISAKCEIEKNSNYGLFGLSVKKESKGFITIHQKRAKTYNAFRFCVFDSNGKPMGGTSDEKQNACFSNIETRSTSPLSLLPGNHTILVEATSNDKVEFVMSAYFTSGNNDSKSEDVIDFCAQVDMSQKIFKTDTYEAFYM